MGYGVFTAAWRQVGSVHAKGQSPLTCNQEDTCLLMVSKEEVSLGTAGESLKAS